MMTQQKDRLLRILFDCGGYYECPKDADGKRLGPLVGYAGKYDKVHHYVGDVYCNMAKIEANPRALERFARAIANRIPEDMPCDKVIGIPNGGNIISFAVAAQIDASFGFLEYREIEAKGRKDKELFLGRHEIEPGSQVILGEDVCNNFSSTDKAISIVERAGATVCAIICSLNRSLEYREEYKGIPIIAAIDKPIPEYMQTDIEVAEDITRGNVIWKPKDHWDELMLAMTQNKVSD